MPRPEITLYVDVVSPFSFIAYHVITHSPVFRDCDVKLVPIFLGGLMKKCNNRPGGVLNKYEYLATERARWIKMFNVPMSVAPPKPFPQNSIYAMRALVAISQKSPERLSECVGVLSQLFWGKLQPIGKEEVWSKALEEVLGEAKPKEIVSLSKTEDVRKALDANTDHAFEAGGFGLPFFTASNGNGEKEAFWGVSHLGLAARHMGLNRNLDEGVRAML